MAKTTEETPKDLEALEEGTRGIAHRWQQEIELAEKDKRYKQWTERCATIAKRYENERGALAEKSGPTMIKYNILWSNLETLRPALYSRTPLPYIRRRFKDADPIGRLSAEALERAVSFGLDDDETFDTEILNCVKDYLLYARGVSWNRYVPIFDPEDEGRLISEQVVTDHINYKDILHNPCRKHRELRWIAKKVYLRRDQLIKEFGEEKGKEVPLDYEIDGADSLKDDEERDAATSDTYKKAVIYEIWDKESRRIYWVHRNCPDLLKEQEDELKLKGFFPCAPFLLGTMSGESIIPTPDYIEYQDQAQELDIITTRIHFLTRALKNNGVYDEACPEIKRIIEESCENDLIGVKNWPSFIKSGGFRGVLEFLPIENIANVVQQLYQAREQVLNTIYQITGLADIIRGSSNPTETATAQQIKGRFATLRLSERQKSVQYFVRDNLRIRAEIIAEHFQPSTIASMAGVALMGEGAQQQFMQSIELLRADPIRNYRIDIETDSTIATDEDLDKQQRSEFLGAVGQFFQSGLPLAQQFPVFAKLMGEMLLFNVRSFKVGRNVEQQLEESLQQFEQELQQAKQQPPPPDPKMMAEQAKMQAKQAELQQKMQVEMGKLQLKQQELEQERQKVHIEAQTEREVAHKEAQTKQQEMQMKYQESQAKMQLEVQKLRAQIGMGNQKESNKFEVERAKLAQQGLGFETKTGKLLKEKIRKTKVIGKFFNTPDGERAVEFETVGVKEFEAPDTAAPKNNRGK